MIFLIFIFRCFTIPNYWFPGKITRQHKKSIQLVGGNRWSGYTTQGVGSQWYKTSTVLSERTPLSHKVFNRSVWTVIWLSPHNILRTNWSDVCVECTQFWKFTSNSSNKCLILLLELTFLRCSSLYDKEFYFCYNLCTVIYNLTDFSFCSCIHLAWRISLRINH